MNGFSPFVQSCIVLALTVLVAVPAAATGTVRIQQHDGSVTNYRGVMLKIHDKTLTLISADKISTVVIGDADCAHEGTIVRCTGGDFTLLQQGDRRKLPFRTANFYVNLTDTDAPMPLSTTKLPAHSVMFAVQTAKGTEITGQGKLDEEPSP
jgi:hypothetical protein